MPSHKMPFERLKLYPYREQICTWLIEGRTRAYICHQLQCDHRTLRTFLHAMQQSGTRYEVPSKLKVKS